MKTPVLETERLYIREVSIVDAHSIQKYFNDWDIIKFTQAPWPYPENGAENHIKNEIIPRIQDGSILAWSVFLKTNSTKMFVGRIDYRLFNEPPDRGFWLAKPYWNKGIMSEAVGATQAYVFENCGVEKIIVKNAKSNTASRRVKEKCGAQYLYDETFSCCHLQEPTEVWELTPKRLIE